MEFISKLTSLHIIHKICVFIYIIIENGKICKFVLPISNLQKKYTKIIKLPLYFYSNNFSFEEPRHDF